MSKTYIIYYTWPNTQNNHAGMAYLLSEFKKASPKAIRLIQIPQSINKWPPRLQRLHLYLLVFWLKLILLKNDKIIFMEYLGGLSGNQTSLAIKLRQLSTKNKFIGLVHLSGSHLLEIYNGADFILKGAVAVDTILVFGSSLYDFFDTLGYGNKVTITFHYVDINYYKPSIGPKLSKLQVIHLGSIKRDIDKIREIVIACPNIDFHICQGFHNLSKYFVNLNNVKLYGYLPEDQLLKLMQICHVSLSIFDDTVGSNVITTSMACGLVNVASDVGSIRDYCSDENSILCKNYNDFIDALLKLGSDENLRLNYSKESLKRAKDFELNKSIRFFQSFLNDSDEYSN
jgi:glycosyltransferase involved in cell wall biosynthesis